MKLVKNDQRLHVFRPHLAGWFFTWHFADACGLLRSDALSSDIYSAFKANIFSMRNPFVSSLAK